WDARPARLRRRPPGPDPVHPSPGAGFARSAEMVVFEGGKRFYRFSGNILSWNRAFRAPQMGFLMGIIYPRFPAFTGRILAVEGCGFSFPALWPKWLPVSIYSKGNIGISQNESMEAAMSEHASKPGLNGAVHK